MGPGLVVLFSFFLQHLETWNHHSAWFVLLHELNNITIQKTKVRAWCTVRILYIRKWSFSQVHLLILLPFLHLKIIFSKNTIFWVEPLLADRATILHKTLSHYVAQGKWNVPPPPHIKSMLIMWFSNTVLALGHRKKTLNEGEGESEEKFLFQSVIL